MNHYFSEFVGLLQALATPAIGAGAAWIGYGQKRQGDVKLQLERYDRRFAIYQAIRSAIAAVTVRGDISDKEMFQLGVDTDAAIFLTNDAVAKYIITLQEQFARLRATNAELASHNLNEGQREAVGNRHVELMAWFRAQYPILVTTFKPLLKI